MCAQGLYRVVIPGQFGFAQGGVDFPVADMVQQNRGPAFPAPEFRGQMVEALRNARRYRAAAERTDGIARQSAINFAWAGRARSVAR